MGRTEKETASHALYWLGKLEAFIDDHSSTLSDGDAVRSFSFLTRHCLLDELLEEKQCSLDFIAFTVYRRIARCATKEEISLADDEAPPQQSTPPYVNFNALLRMLRDGGDELEYFKEYTTDHATDSCDLEEWPRTLGQYIDREYPFHRVKVHKALTAPAWSVPLPTSIDLENHIYFEPRILRSGLSGLDIRYDGQTHTLRPVLPARIADTPCTPKTLAENPFLSSRMRQALNILSEWVYEMSVQRKIVPLIDFLHELHAKVVKGESLVQAADFVHKRWVDGSLRSSLKEAEASA